MGEPRVGAAQVAGHVGVAHREAAHVGLVDDRVRPRGVRAAVLPPGEEGVDDHAAGDAGLGVELAHLLVALALPAVAEELRSPAQLARDRLRVGVHQQLVGVVAQPLGGGVATVDPVAVVLPRSHPVDVAMPVQVGALGELERHRRRPGAVDEDQLHALGGGGEEGEVRPLPVPRRPQGDEVTGPGRLHAAAVAELMAGHDRGRGRARPARRRRGRRPSAFGPAPRQGARPRLFQT